MIKNLANFFIVAMGTILILIYGQSILIQVIIAFLLWFATVQIKKSLHKIKGFDAVLPNFVQSLIIACILVSVVYLVMNLITSNLSVIMSSYKSYETNIYNAAARIEDLLKINLAEQMMTLLKSIDIQNIFSQLANGLSSIFSNFMMVLIYLLFIFLESNTVGLKIAALFPNEKKRANFNNTLKKIEKSLAGYFRVKTLMSLLTGFLSFIVLKIVGVDAPAFWAFLIFLLNYIPTIGSLVATVFPAIFSLLQFGTFIPFIIIILAIGAIQMVVGNFIEPRVVGKSLNVSPIVTIISLAIWGQLWGVIGMLLSVPITVIMIIILSQFENTKNIAIILSEKGEL